LASLPPVASGPSRHSAGKLGGQRDALDDLEKRAKLVALRLGSEQRGKADASPRRKARRPSLALHAMPIFMAKFVSAGVPFNASPTKKARAPWTPAPAPLSIRQAAVQAC